MISTGEKRHKKLTMQGVRGEWRWSTRWLYADKGVLTLLHLRINYAYFGVSYKLNATFIRGIMTTALAVVQFEFI